MSTLLLSLSCFVLGVALFFIGLQLKWIDVVAWGEFLQGLGAGLIIGGIAVYVVAF